MSTSEKETCRRCGAVVPANSAEALCPACLLSGALEPPDAPTETIPLAPGGSLSLQGPSEFPCEFGDYRLLGLLGRGGMGTVYEAEQLSTGRRLALKMLGQQLDSPEMRQRFLREGRLAARVNHPNSLFVFGSEEVDSRPAITMEIAGSGTLKDQLKQRGPLPIAEAVDATLDIISGLESALAGGVLHRDVKPSNCFVCPDGSVKVGDFGLSVSTLAKTDTFVTAHGKIMGTPAYASPEQLRGDDLDVRSDIYSVGATLFTLLTDRAPFEGENAVQVVANAVNQQPTPLTELRGDVPPELARAVNRCLAKEPGGRYADYAALRNALLPFSSKKPEPAPIQVRASAAWIDYLVALLPPYVTLMFVVGSNKLLVLPVVAPSLYTARYYFLLFGCGFLYFTIVEGIWGAGLGKWLKGLRVVRVADEPTARPPGQPPGMARALIRIVIPLLLVEGVRMPLMMALISGTDWTVFQVVLFIVAPMVCAWIPALLMLRARRENGFATGWDLATGTRVVIKPKGTVRPAIAPEPQPECHLDHADLLGPYEVLNEVVSGEWIIGTDPVLRRRVWLLRRTGPEPPLARRNVGRAGRQRWLQKVQVDDATWDAFEAPPGVPLAHLIEGGKRVSWGTLRHWLHDIASELWAATGDQTLPIESSVDHVWITTEGRAILLDEPWPMVKTPAERITVDDFAGQQRFLHALAAGVESTSLPLHARGVLQNLEAGRFEKLSFLTGTLRGLLDRPAEVSRGIRAGSIFMLPVYTWIAVLVGHYHDKEWDSVIGVLVTSALVVLGAIALVQLLGLPFRSTASQSIFRLAVVNANGEPAALPHRLARWAVVWLPLFLPLAIVTWLTPRHPGVASILTLALLLLWIGAALYAVVNPNRGWHDQLARTWVVRH